jgi:hypothetical protein
MQACALPHVSCDCARKRSEVLPLWWCWQKRRGAEGPAPPERARGGGREPLSPCCLGSIRPRPHRVRHPKCELRGSGRSDRVTVCHKESQSEQSGPEARPLRSCCPPAAAMHVCGGRDARKARDAAAAVPEPPSWSLHPPSSALPCLLPAQHLAHHLLAPSRSHSLASASRLSLLLRLLRSLARGLLLLAARPRIALSRPLCPSLAATAHMAFVASPSGSPSGSPILSASTPSPLAERRV